MNLHHPDDRPTARIVGTVNQSDVIALCHKARSLEQAGEYEHARAILAEFWSGVGEPVRLEGLSRAICAELNLRVGVLTGYLGSAQQIEGAQEAAKELLTIARRHFREQKNREKAAEAESALGVCYWREGAYGEACVWFRAAIATIRNGSHPVALLAYINLMMAFRAQGNYESALQIASEIEEAVRCSDDDGVKARYFNTCGLLYYWTAKPERALEYYLLASKCFSKAGHRRFCGHVESNIGNIYLSLNQPAEAQYHLTQARQLFEELRDACAHAEVLENLARAYLMQGSYAQAEHLARASVDYFGKGDEHARLFIALKTHARTLTYTGNTIEALAVYNRAYRVAAQRLGQPALDELLHELEASVYFRKGLSFKEETHRFEAEEIRRALLAASGSVTHAAQKLGMQHQSLIEMLNNRHSDLQGERKPSRSRPFRNIVKKERSKKRRLRRARPELNYIVMGDDNLKNLGIRAGDTLFIVSTHELRKNDCVVIEVTTTGDYHVGMISWEVGLVCLWPCTDEYEPMPFAEDAITILGKVIGYCHDPLNADSIFIPLRRPHDEQ